MNLLQRLAYAFARWSGLLPPLPGDLLSQACALVVEMEAAHKREAGEFRRHQVLKRLVALGFDPRAAAVAIEIAVARSLR